VSKRTASLLAWSMWALSLALTALSLLLLVLNLSHPNTHIFDWWLSNTTIVIDVTVGAIVASRRPENPVGWLLCLSGLTVSVGHFSSQYAIYALLAQPDSLPAGQALAWVASWNLSITIGLQVFYLLLFPTGGLPSIRWRWLVWLTGAFVLVGAILSAFSSDAYLGSLGPIRNPLGIEGFTNVYKAVLYAVAPLLYVAVALSLFMRLRRAVGVERQQLKWLAYAAATFAIGIILEAIIPSVTEPPLWAEVAGYALFIAGGAAIPVAIGIAILRYRLYEIDLIINRTLVYGSLTAMLAFVYFGSVTLLQYLFSLLTGPGSTLAIVASTLAIAALFNPLRRRIHGFIDRRFYRRKYDAAKTLEAFGSRLRDETDLEKLCEDLGEVVDETMQPAHVSVILRSEVPSSTTTREQGQQDQQTTTHEG
jgi:hypothetical protein